MANPPPPPPYSPEIAGEEPRFHEINIHEHCRTCFDSFCERVDDACKVVICNYCRARLHKCKGEDHMEICVGVKRPCLNARHGCPEFMLKRHQATHLIICPANVQVCTMSWNRGALAKHDRPLFLANLTQHRSLEASALDPTPEIPVVEDLEDEPGFDADARRTTRHLDVALATRDQQSLFHYMHAQTEGSIWPLCQNPYVHNLDALNATSMIGSALAPDLISSIDSIQAFKSAFSSFVKATNATFSSSSSQIDFYDALETQSGYSSQITSSSPRSPEKSISATIIHPVPKASRWLPQPKQFVSQGCDPMWEIKPTPSKSLTDDDFSILGPEVCLYDVDFCERFFRMIGCDNSPHIGFNRRYVFGRVTYDKCTQTVPYPAALLSTDLMAGPISAAPALNSADSRLTQPPIMASTPRLGIGMIIESHTEQIQKNQLRFICAQEMRRDEYCGHYKNVHDDIHANLNGWFEQRCPYSSYGCSCTKIRLLPNSGRDTIVHDASLGCFTCTENDLTTAQHESYDAAMFPFLLLPNVLLYQVFQQLDSYTLNQMTKVSRRCRFMALQLLHRKGIVSREWRKTKLIEKAAGLEVRGEVWRRTGPRWKFSSCFNPVENWRISNESLKISQHLDRECNYAKKARESFLKTYNRPVRLVSMRSDISGADYPEGEVVGDEYIPESGDEVIYITSSSEFDYSSDE